MEILSSLVDERFGKGQQKLDERLIQIERKFITNDLKETDNLKKMD